MSVDVSALEALIGTVKKAKLVSLDKSSDTVELHFNPEKGSLKLARNIRWQFSEGLDPEDATGGPAGFIGGDPDVLSFSTLLDDTTGGTLAVGAAAGKSALALALTLATIDGTNRLITGTRVAVLSGLDLVTGVADMGAEALLRKLDKSSVHKIIKQLYFLTTPDGVTGDDPRPSVVKFTWGDFDFVGVITDLDIEYLVVTETGYPKRAMAHISMKGRSFTGSSSADDFMDPPVWKRPSALGGLI